MPARHSALPTTACWRSECLPNGRLGALCRRRGSRARSLPAMAEAQVKHRPQERRSTPETFIEAGFDASPPGSDSRPLIVMPTSARSTIVDYRRTSCRSKFDGTTMFWRPWRGLDEDGKKYVQFRGTWPGMNGASGTRSTVTTALLAPGIASAAARGRCRTKSHIAPDVGCSVVDGPRRRHATQRDRTAA